MCPPRPTANPRSGTPPVFLQMRGRPGFCPDALRARVSLRRIDFCVRGNGDMEPQLLLGSDLVGATLGVVGFGRIGQRSPNAPGDFDCV